MSSTTGTTAVNTDGATNVAHDVKKKSGSDCIDDRIMEEIARRLISFLESEDTGCCSFTPEPPNDKRKIWIQTDATGSIIGTIKRFDSKTGQWVDDHLTCEDCEFEEGGAQRLPQFFTEASQTTSLTDTTLDFNHNFGTNSYMYTFKFTDVPKNDTRWWEESRDENTVSITIRDGQIKDSGGQPLPNYIEILEVLEPLP